MIRADWEAATPKCPGTLTNLGVKTCGRPLEWKHEAAARWGAADGGVWTCYSHGKVLTGAQAAERAGMADELAA